ncbi:Heterogeneous nuclear ribonucleoprotein Q [Linum grandiflorum]
MPTEKENASTTSNRGEPIDSDEKIDLNEDNDPEEAMEEEIEYEEVEEEEEVEEYVEEEIEVEEEGEESEDDDEKKKHAELLALPPHGSEVYIGGIPHNTTQEDLRGFCESIGEVTEVRMMKGKNPTDSKVFAFVTFKGVDLASKAIKELNNSEFKDPRNTSNNRGFGFIEYYNNACAEYSRQKMTDTNFKLGDNSPTVSWADSRHTNSAAATQVKALYVKNLPKDVTQDELKKLFEHHGQITKVVLPPAKQGQENNRIGFIHFAERSCAMEALESTEKYELNGQTLECSLAKPQTDQKAVGLSNIQHAGILPSFPPYAGYGLGGAAFGSLATGYGTAPFAQPMMYGTGPSPSGMAMMPMLLPDGQIGYILVCVDSGQSEMENGSEIELGKAAKRLRKGENSTAAVDRLSNLPNFILYHILSFLDTKYAVQTSVLSRVWRCVWKHLDVVNLRRSNFQSVSSFAKFVRRALLNRFELDVSKVSFIDDVGPWKQIVQNMLDKVVNYAFAHDCRHLVIDLEVEDCDCLYRFGAVPSSSLRTLEIRNVVIDDGFGSSGFPSLTSLILKTCLVNPDQEGSVDLISNLPSLMDLVIEDCYSHSCLRRVTSIVIHGPQLVNLELAAALEDYNIKVAAPKLRSFSLQLIANWGSSPMLSKLSLSSLPSLNHVIITVANYSKANDQVQINDFGWNSLFRGLHDVNSVLLRCNNNRVLMNLCHYLEHNPHPFTRLKSLVCFSDDKPAKEMKYSLDGSSCGEAKYLRRVSGIAPKRTAVPVDRLTNLPNCILYQILSLLDTKHAVQTSVLSRVWRSVWKHLDVITLRRSNFDEISDFAKFINSALSLRFQLDLSKVSFIDDQGPCQQAVQNMLNKVVKYAFSCNCQHLVIDLEIERGYVSSYTFGSVPSSSLRTLEIRNVLIHDEFGSSGFPSVTSLILKTCPMIPDRQGNVDLISNFPSLVDLVVYNCSSRNRISGKVYRKVNSIALHGPQLVNLELAALPTYNIKLVAPKLQVFRLRVVVDSKSSPVLSKLSLSRLPCLDHADILVYKADDFFIRYNQETDFGWNLLFQGLHDANSVMIYCCDNHVLKNLCDFLGRGRHPFTKLKTLVCFTDAIPPQAVTYSLDGSSCREATKCLRRL